MTIDIYEQKLQQLEQKDAGRQTKLERCCPHLARLQRKLEAALKRRDEAEIARLQALIAAAQKP